MSDMNPEKVEAPNLDPDGKYIRSTRIRVARNLKGYGLAPSLGKQERIDLEKKVNFQLRAAFTIMLVLAYLTN